MSWPSGSEMTMPSTGQPHAESCRPDRSARGTGASARDPYPDGQPDCVPPGGDSRLSARESRLVIRPADEFRVVRRSTEPTVFVESARARSM